MEVRRAQVELEETELKIVQLPLIALDRLDRPHHARLLLDLSHRSTILWLLMQKVENIFIHSEVLPVLFLFSNHVLQLKSLISGIPLLEENEMENEGSNSSEPGDTASATCSEGSSK